MKLEPLGESAFLIRETHLPAHRLAARLNRIGIPGLVEAVAGYDAVGVYVDPDVFQSASLLSASVEAGDDPSESGKLHRIPVCYELGLDLAETAVSLNISTAELIELHTAVTYRCYAIGFCPGFPYLGYLDSRLQGVPRRASPRARIEPGSVGMTGNQTGIYPLERPGGWPLIGKTPFTLVDLPSQYFPISAGDQVQFFAVDLAEFECHYGERL